MPEGMVKEREGLFRILLDISFCFYFCLFLISLSWGFWSQALQAWRMISDISTLTNIFLLSKKKSKGLNISKSKGKSMQLRIFFNTEDFKIQRSLISSICCLKFHPARGIYIYTYIHIHMYVFIYLYVYSSFMFIYKLYIIYMYILYIYISPQKTVTKLLINQLYALFLPNWFIHLLLNWNKWKVFKSTFCYFVYVMKDYEGKKEWHRCLWASLTLKINQPYGLFLFSCSFLLPFHPSSFPFILPPSLPSIMLKKWRNREHLDITA